MLTTKLSGCLLLFACGLLLAGCEKKPAEETSSTGVGGKFRVERLFTHEGCTVYRFEDYYTRYFARCDGAASSGVEWSESCGKSCTRPVTVPTGSVRK